MMFEQQLRKPTIWKQFLCIRGEFYNAFHDISCNHKTWIHVKAHEIILPGADLNSYCVGLVIGIYPIRPDYPVVSYDMNAIWPMLQWTAR